MVTDLSNLISVGQRFKIHYRNPWSGPCPQCNRRQARTRKYKQELPCTNHQPVHGVEDAWYLSEVTTVDHRIISYRQIERLSLKDPLPGTEGRDLTTGGMTIVYFFECEADGSIVLT